jgi:hypothetical protein
MPQRSTSIYVPQPCAESWAAMTPTATGRHCAACQKTVVDFTQKTDAEILAYFRQVGTGRTCGRFHVGQLERPLRSTQPVARPRHWQLWLAGLLATALTVQSCQPTIKEIHPATSQYLPPPPPPEILPPAIDSTTVGDIKTLMADSTAVSAAPHSSGELVNDVLGEPEKY